MFHLLRTLLFTLLLSFGARAATPSFGDFDKRAQAGERLSVVFFGASLTWGANATDPPRTSWRGEIARRLESRYPAAHFTFHDAAIGGTSSQLGAFRLERDVLSHRPDLVFLDFTANDGIQDATPETLASYEALLRRIIGEARAPVVQMIFPFGWDVQSADLTKMKRRDAHLELSRDYHTVTGDAVTLAMERVKSGATTLEKIWPDDFVHPGDAGYLLFADAAWAALTEGVKNQTVCVVPEKMRYAPTYLHASRVRLSTLSSLPEGWRTGRPNLTSAYFDMLMSRWLDDEVIASNRVETTGPDGKKTLQPREAAPLTIKFRGTAILLFGEGTPKSAKYRARLDGKPLSYQAPGAKSALTEFDAAGIAGRANGNAHHYQVLAEGLDASVEHTLEIEPLFSSTLEQELRLESLCVAGGEAPANKSPGQEVPHQRK